MTKDDQTFVQDVLGAGAGSYGRTTGLLRLFFTDNEQFCDTCVSLGLILRLADVHSHSARYSTL